MIYLRGFDAQILESLESKNKWIRQHAVEAAGNWSLKGAWSRVKGLLTSRKTNKDQLLAAIEAVPYIRPEKAGDVLGHLLDSKDEDIADAAGEAIDMARATSGDDEFEDW